MGIKTQRGRTAHARVHPLKNLPTTWGLRPYSRELMSNSLGSLKNLPTTWGLRLFAGYAFPSKVLL